MGQGLTPTICLKCKFYKGEKYIDVFTNGLEGRYVSYCDAFDDIPDEILRGDNLHKSKHPEQENDIVFEPVDKEEKE